MNCMIVCEKRQIINNMNRRFILQSPKVLLEYYYLTGSQSERFSRCMGWEEALFRYEEIQQKQFD